MNKQSEKMTLFTWFTEIVFWIKTFLSPVFGGLLIGSICYFYIESVLGVYLFWIFCVAGFVGGIYLANRIWKTQGTVHFQSKIIATPDIDDFKNHKISSKGGAK